MIAIQETERSLDLNAVAVRRSGLCCHELDGEAVLYDVAQHSLHYLNATAYLIWRNCDGRTTAGRLLEKIRSLFAVPHAAANENIMADTVATMNSLAANGLIAWGRILAE